MKAKRKIIFLFIIILASCLRLWRLSDIPEGFHSDEAAFGYNAYSILLTSKDEYGKFLPLILRSFDDYKGAIYSYLTIPFIKLFGLSELAVRLPTAIFGIGLVILTYFLAKKLTSKINLALFAAFLMAICPSSIFLSRVQSDPLVAVFFVVLGFYCFLLWREKDNLYLFLLSILFWAVSFYTYVSPRVFFPIFLLLTCIFYFNRFDIKQRKMFIAGYVFLLILDFFLIFGASGARLGQINFAKSPQVITPIEEGIREDNQASSKTLIKFFHNKIVGYSDYLIDNYLQYFSFDFLFLKGGLPSRETVPRNGILYKIELPLLIFGIYFIFRKKVRWGYFMVGWLLLFPVVLSFASDETPNVHRFFLAIVPIELIVAFGAGEIFRIIRRNKLATKLFFIIFILVLAQNFTFFLHYLFIHQPVHNPKNRGYAYKNLSALITKYSKNFNQIVITKGNVAPYIYLLFYQHYDPKRYQALGSPRDFDNTGFDKFFFVPENCPLQNVGKKGVLYVNQGDCSVPSQNAKVLETVKWKDGSNAFILLESDTPS